MEPSNNRYDLLFVTTFLDLDNINFFLNSLTHNRDIDIRIVLIAQNGLVIDLSEFHFNRVSIDIVSRADKLPISVARNIGLKYAKDQQIDYLYAMFPDDDSTFDTQFFANFKSQVRGNTLIGVRTRENIDQHYLTLPKNRRQANGKTDYNFAISVNILVKKTTVEAVDGFNEQLGVGCYYGAGEDCDFYIRSSKVAQFEFNDKLYSIHPAQTRIELSLPYDKLVSRYKSYGRGAVYMFCKNRLFAQAVKVVLYGFMGAASCLCHGRFKMCRVYFIASVERYRTLQKYIFSHSK